MRNDRNAHKVQFRQENQMHKEVTGRDGYIITKALAYAIAFIDSLTEQKREKSDRDDMVAILIALAPDEAWRERIAEDVRIHTGIAPDLTDWKSYKS